MYKRAIFGGLRAECGSHKCTISSATAFNADLQWAENTRAASCWVALREKGINAGVFVYVCMLVWSWVKYLSLVAHTHFHTQFCSWVMRSD